jgi:hypothetical protein
VSIEGVDYAYGWRQGLGAELASTGKSFVCRYLSGGGGKDLGVAEINDLHRAGLGIVVVWETDGRTGPLMGSQGGALDARAALAEAARLAIPAGACLYFAVDFDATAGEIPTLRAYFATARELCHTAGYRIGDYGGWTTIEGDYNSVDLCWQTYAWSHGNWSSHAVLQQYSNGQPLCGITVDLDRALQSDYGQFGGGASPVVEDSDLQSVCVRDSDQSQHIFQVAGGSLWHKFWRADQGGWGNEQIFKGVPLAAMRPESFLANGQLHVSAEGQDARMHHAYQDDAVLSGQWNEQILP